MVFWMGQARVLKEPEFQRLLAVMEARRHAARNRAAIMLSHLAGLRVGEIAHLTVGDVYQADGEVRERIELKKAYTKGNHARTVYVGSRLKVELTRYQETIRASSQEVPLLRSQKGGAFSANTLGQVFGGLFQAAGIVGASSHSGRRSLITKMEHSDVSAKVIMTLAGHKHLGTTQRYIDVDDDMLRAAVERI